MRCRTSRKLLLVGLGCALAGAGGPGRADSDDPVTALGRLEPRGGPVRVAGPSVPVAVIAALDVEEGESVKQGQVIARLDRYPLQQALVRQHEAELVAAEAELRRAKDLAHGLAGAASRREDAEAAVRAAQAGLDAARAELELALVRAPIAGRVLEVHARAGERVGPDGVVELGRTDEMFAVAEVYETDIGRVRTGQQATVTSPALAEAARGRGRARGSQDRPARRGRRRPGRQDGRARGRGADPARRPGGRREPDEPPGRDRDHPLAALRAGPMAFAVPALLVVPIAWLQLTRDKVRLLVAIAGVAFAVVLVCMQLGFQDALFRSSVRYHQSLRYDLAMISPKTAFIVQPEGFSRRRLHQVRGVPGVAGVTELYLGLGTWKNPEKPADTRRIFVVGFDPSDSIFDLPGIEAAARGAEAPRRRALRRVVAARVRPDPAPRARGGRRRLPHRGRQPRRARGRPLRARHLVRHRREPRHQRPQLPPHLPVSEPPGRSTSG